MNEIRCTYSHWLPLVTRCPLSRWPDLGYVTVEADGFVELYSLRALIRLRTLKKTFVEKLVDGIGEDLRAIHIDRSFRVTYRMIGGRVVVSKEFCKS